jgi:hypothetical protein
MEGIAAVGYARGLSLEQVMATQNQVPVDENTRKAALNRRLESFGWGALLIVIGTIWLLPESQVPHGSWLIAAGIILLGLNAVRCINGISMSSFSLIAGFIALTMGLGAFFGVKLPLFAIVLIVVGAGILLKMLLEKDAMSMSHAGRGWSCCGRMMQDTSSQDRAGQVVVGRS